MWRHIEADDFSREPSRILWMRFLSKMIRVVEAHLRHSHHCSLGVQSRRARNRQNKRSTQSTRASKKTWKKGSLSSKADTKIPSQKFFFHLPYLVGSIEVEVLRVGSCVFGTRFMRCRSVLTARSPDWQCLLGTFLFGAWYPAWWSDAERQDDWRPRIGSKTRFRRMSKIWPTKNHNTLASSDWTFQSVSWPLHCSAKTNDFLIRIFVALLWTFLLVHGTIFLDRWLAGGGDDAFNTLLDFGEWSFCSFPQYTTYIYIHYGWLFMWFWHPGLYFLDVNVEGSSLRQGQASTCQDAWWLTWSQLSPRCVWAKHFLRAPESTLPVRVFHVCIEQQTSLHGFLKTGGRWSSHWYIPPAVPSWAIDLWKGRRRQQFCQGALHHRQGDCGSCLGQDPQVGR